MPCPPAGGVEPHFPDLTMSGPYPHRAPALTVRPGRASGAAAVTMSGGAAFAALGVDGGPRVDTHSSSRVGICLLSAGT